MGLPDLITVFLEYYRYLEYRLSRETEKLAELRTRLMIHRQTTMLFDGARFVRNLEKAYTTMWEIYTSGAASGFYGQGIIRPGCFPLATSSLPSHFFGRG